jgi:KUP system potassium uptake protein
VPITVGIVIVLFALQRRGTERVGALFGPVMMVWFVGARVFGAMMLVDSRTCCRAQPGMGAQFFFAHKLGALLALGAVVLAVTGGEALYADMGHFGKLPIRDGWTFVVLPALMLNYLGQGALLLRPPGRRQPFYLMVPRRPARPMICWPRSRR